MEIAAYAELVTERRATKHDERKKLPRLDIEAIISNSVDFY